MSAPIVTIDLRDVQKMMGELGDQVPYAAMRALNECATAFQGEQRAHMQGAFTIRRPWVLQGVKINRGDFATKQNLSVRIHIAGNRDFLNKFEDGGVKRPRSGRSLAIPISVKRTKAQVVSKTQRPKAFNFVEARTSMKSRMSIYKGSKRTFMIRRSDGTGVILQRSGKQAMGPSRTINRSRVKGRSYGHDPNLKILWALKGHARTPKSLHFARNAKRSFLSKWPGTFQKWYLEALGGRRGLNTLPKPRN